jgi:hypothetical protein
LPSLEGNLQELLSADLTNSPGESPVAARLRPARLESIELQQVMSPLCSPSRTSLADFLGSNLAGAGSLPPGLTSSCGSTGSPHDRPQASAPQAAVAASPTAYDCAATPGLAQVEVDGAATPSSRRATSGPVPTLRSLSQAQLIASTTPSTYGSAYRRQAPRTGMPSASVTSTWGPAAAQEPLVETQRLAVALETEKLTAEVASHMKELEIWQRDLQADARRSVNLPRSHEGASPSTTAARVANAQMAGLLGRLREVVGSREVSVPFHSSDDAAGPPRRHSESAEAVEVIDCDSERPAARPNR